MRRIELCEIVQRYLVPVACVGTLLAFAGAGNARDEISGPVAATVVRVIDGDTFVAEAHVWPGETVRVSVRIRGIDAPELHSRCPEERTAATEARDALVALLDGQAVTISNIGGGKYYGRVLADVDTGARAVAPVMLSQALVRHYSGGHRRPYCG